MILSDSEIRKRLQNKSLIIEPLEDESIQIQPASVDLKLGNSFLIYKQLYKVIDLNNFDIKDYYDIINLSNNNPFILPPQSFVLGTTLEWVKIPNDLVARVDGRSTMGRLGILIHATAGYIDPGFEGNITLELSNVGSNPVTLYPGMRICQISFEVIFGKVERPYNKNRGSHYMGQRGVTPPDLSGKL